MQQLTAIAEIGQGENSANATLSPLKEDYAREAVCSFFSGLKRISREAGDSLTQPVRIVIDELNERDGTVSGTEDRGQCEDVVSTAKESLAEYAGLLCVWPAILAGLDDELKGRLQARAAY